MELGVLGAQSLVVQRPRSQPVSDRTLSWSLQLLFTSTVKSLH